MSRALTAFSRFLVVAALSFAALAAHAADPPAPTRWVTDEAGFLSTGARQYLDHRLEAYERQTGHQVIVWIGRTSGAVPVDDFAVRAFKAWQVGRKGLDDGLALFVFADDRKVRIEVGYGLEGQVPDAVASRVIRETIIPKIQAGDHDGAIQAGVEALLTAIGGGGEGTGVAQPQPGGESARARPLSLANKIFIAVIVIAFLILLVTNPSFALWLLFNLVSGGRGGGGGGGGGYSGGGGRSGGGGASGSW